MTSYMVLQMLHATWVLPFTVIMINLALLQLIIAGVNLGLTGCTLLLRSVSHNSKEFTHALCGSSIPKRRMSINFACKRKRK